LSINEEFIFDYALSPRRGIIRSIPLVLDEHGRHFTLSSLSVTDKAATPYPFEHVSGGNIATIKVGDPTKALTGTHYYDIKYTLKNVAGETDLKWTILSPVREPIRKFQADIYFPIPVPEQTATATCAFAPIGGECIVFPLSKSGLTAGYRIATEMIKGQSITVALRYPQNLIIPENQKTRGTSSISFLSVALVSGVFGSVTYYTWTHRSRLLRIISRFITRSSPRESFSYLVRAYAVKNTLEKEDIVATVADLIERGYLGANPRGEHDYVIFHASEDRPEGAEGYLYTLFSQDGISLAEWLSGEFDQQKSILEGYVQKELLGVTLHGEDESLPTLKNFIIPE
jgi:hypothetical protein